MPSNAGAWLTGAKTALKVKSAPYTPPGEDEIVMKNGVVAINPVDYIKVDSTNIVFPWIELPFIQVTDVAGEVVNVGCRVTRFSVGDRVLTYAVGAGKNYNTSAKGAFQNYTVALPHMKSQIPESMSYNEAAVVPLGLSTAACGLFQTDQLALQPPSPTGKTVLIWGGSISVGGNAFQLTVAASYEVITTCSPRNFAYVKKLGASEVIDYNSSVVIPDIVKAFKNKIIAGAFSIGHGAADACIDILYHSKGNKIFAMASSRDPEIDFPLYFVSSPPYRYLVLLHTVWYFGSCTATYWCKGKTRDIHWLLVAGSTLIKNDIGKMIYEDYLPTALAESNFVAAPEPCVVGEGFESIQTGWDVQRKVVSAKNVLVTL